MAEVKWIKIVTDIFDDEKVLLIESLPEHDAIIVLWFKLLCLAGKMNNSGVFIMNNKIPYTEEMLATIFRRPINTVRLALNTFEQFGMIERVDNVITIPNWGKHQNLDQLETYNEKMRNYMRSYRKKQKEKVLPIGVNNSKVNSKVNVNGIDKIRLDIDKEVDIEEDKDSSDKDKLDKLDKTLGIASENYNFLTQELIRRKFISEADLDVYRYDRFLESLAKSKDYKLEDILTVISYVLKQMESKDYNDKFNYFCTSIINGLKRINRDFEYKSLSDEEISLSQELLKKG